MGALSTSLVRLAEAYEQLLFEGELSRRLSHHMAHVASERWLAMELAMLVNERAADFGLPGWTAIVEKGVVDVSLIPPGTSPRLLTLPPEAIFLELKLIGAEYWSTNWREVNSDLTGKSPKKPRADFAVCFLLSHLSHPITKRRPKTEETYRAFHAAIPHDQAVFEPIVGEPRLELLRSSAEHRLTWPRPVPLRWPDGFEATVRILWITECGRLSKLRELDDAAGPGDEGEQPQ
jgi:hypothetical protein